MAANEQKTGHAGRAGAILIALWGLGGLVYLLCHALNRLTPLALEPWQTGDLLWWQAVIYVAWVALNAWAEGYRGFQKHFSPRFVDRITQLTTDWQSPSRSSVRNALLAPMYCMSLIDAPRRDLVRSWALVLGIITVVIAIRVLPQPWRGIIDGGVVVGLAWGLVATVIQFARIVPALVSSSTERSRTPSLD
jgi:hypothetical protein